jgi:uroporphyrin-III C-methyltransferase / precorrin-2 dehydrogenase / sirohydrochlorin ferrochelatase
MNSYSKIDSLPVLLRNPKILLIGGGKVALQKAKVLKENEIDFHIVTLEICDELKSLEPVYTIKYFSPADSDEFNIIIDATGNKDVNQLLLNLKEKRFFLLNTVDVPEQCDFYFSSLIRYKNLKVAVSSDGASPTLTQVVRNRIKDFLPRQLSELALQKVEERKIGLINPEQTRGETTKLFGKVFLVGCGTGDPDLLTIKALKTIQSVDVVLYDNLITEEILLLVPERTEKIFVGKSKGNHSSSQKEINRLLLDYARLGYLVARLKNGDPFIFGRGAEEVEFLLDNNINVEVVAGISSSLAAPLSAGIPPTARGYSSGVSIVTAHLDGCLFNDKWIDFLKIENHTTIVLMGLTQTELILKHAIEKGIGKDFPFAIISNATRKNQKVVVSTLENLVELSKQVERPSVIVFGEVVKYAGKFSSLITYLQEEKINYPT